MLSFYHVLYLLWCWSATGNSSLKSLEADIKKYHIKSVTLLYNNTKQSKRWYLVCFDGQKTNMKNNITLNEIGNMLVGIQSQVQTVATKVNELSVRVDELSDRVDKLTVRVDELSDRVDKLTVRVDDLSDRVDKLTVRVENLENDVKIIKTDVAAIKACPTIQRELSLQH